jgi:hypothetical protein
MIKLKKETKLNRIDDIWAVQFAETQIQMEKKVRFNSPIMDCRFYFKPPIS